MKRYAIYGKGGIGKSTITCALSAALAEKGYRVFQVGCDPKADSTASLLGGKTITPIADYLRQHDEFPTLNDVIVQGYGGVYCAEAGGPTPGIGCAGRGILMAFHLLDELDAINVIKPDYVLYDVLGDVVCGGFAAPIRDNYADEVIIVTSGEKMSLFAANNIYQAVENFKDSNYARVRGVILNKRNVPDEERLVDEFLQRYYLSLLGTIPRDNAIPYYENQNKTVIEGESSLPIAEIIREIVEKL